MHIINEPFEGSSQTCDIRLDNMYRTQLQKTLNTGRNPTARTRPKHEPTFLHSSALGYFSSKFPPRQTLSESECFNNSTWIVQISIYLTKIVIYLRMKDTILSTCQRRNSSPAISTSWPQPWSRGQASGQASAYDWRNTPSESFDFHSQS